jgi:hypothetical protein
VTSRDPAGERPDHVFVIKCALVDCVLSVVELADHLKSLAQRGWIDFRDSSGTLVDVSQIDLRAELERPDRDGMNYGLTVAHTETRCG